MMQITELLRKYRLSNVKAVAANGDTMLHLVVMDENFTAQEKIEILRILLDNGLNMHSKNKNEETVLHLTIKNRAKDVIEFLLTRKVVLDSVALYFIQKEYNKLFQLKHQSRISDDKMQEEESDSASFLEWMVTKGLDIDRPDRYGQSALFLAIYHDLQHFLPVLLKYTNNINYYGYETKRTLLHMVLEYKPMTRWSPSYRQRYAESNVKILLDRGVSPEFADKSLNTALHMTLADYKGINPVQMIIDHTTNFNHKNKDGETPLFIAIRKCLKREKKNIAEDYLIICQSLIMNGADVNGRSKSGYTPLHVFAEQASYHQCLDEEAIKLFEILIRNVCNVNVECNSRGETPLHLAAAGRNMECVRKPNKNDGAHINPRNDEGTTPIYFKATCKETVTEITEMLIENGANINAKDLKGLTPLHKAVCDQSSYPRDCGRLKLLLEYGADFSTLSNEGYSVLQMGVWKYDYSCFFSPDDSDEEPLRLEDVSESYFFIRSGYVAAGLKFLLNHWIKLYVAKLECRMGDPFKTQGIKKGLRYYPESRTVYQDCMKEIKILKNTFIDNNRTSIYAFIHMNLDSRRAIIYNKKLQELVHSPSQLEKQFPQYAILILSSYNETIRRKSLMKPAKIAWEKFTKTNLGDLCMEHIFSFLSNVELYKFIGASEIDYSR